jgi:hypothetical protein
MSILLDQQPVTKSFSPGIVRTPSLDTAITSISNSLKSFSMGGECEQEREEDEALSDCPRTLSAESAVSAQTTPLHEGSTEIPHDKGMNCLLNPERWLPSSRAMYNFHVGLAAHGESSKNSRSQSPCSPISASDDPEDSIAVTLPRQSRRHSDVTVWDQLLE